MKKTNMQVGLYAAHGKSLHGGYDSGAVNHRLNLHEHQLSVALCKWTADALSLYECEVETMNMEGDMDLNQIIAHANRSRFDVILTPHLNAHTGTAYGTEAYYYPNDKMGRAVADHICKELSVTLNIPQRSNGIDDGGDKASTYFGFVRDTKPTAILLETCFLSTDSEAKKVDENHEQKAVGQAVARGIATGCGFGKKTNVPDKMGKWCIGQFNEQTKDREDVGLLLDGLREIGYGVWYE